MQKKCNNNLVKYPIKDNIMRHQRQRKSLVSKQINLVNNGNLSLEGFFDLFKSKKKKEDEDKIIDLDSFIDNLENSENVTIKTQFNDFNSYYDTLKDFEGPVLDFLDKNIQRVSKYLDLFSKYKGGIVNHLTELEKAGAFNLANAKNKSGLPVFKTKYYMALALQSNSNDVSELEVDYGIEFTEEQKEFLKTTEYLIDIDFINLYNVDNKENITIKITTDEKVNLAKVLKKISIKLKNLKKKATELEALFYDTMKLYLKILKDINLDDNVIKDDYISFGGSVYQGLGYLYDIKEGYNKDLQKEIKLGS